MFKKILKIIFIIFTIIPAIFFGILGLTGLHLLTHHFNYIVLCNTIFSIIICTTCCIFCIGGIIFLFKKS